MCAHLFFGSAWAQYLWAPMALPCQLSKDPSQTAPDHDLGKSVKPNCRNVVREDKDRHRSFGVPTIRTDIPFKDFKSVADY